MRRCFHVDVVVVNVWEHILLPQPFKIVYSVDYYLKVFRNKDDFCDNIKILSEVIGIYYDPILNGIFVYITAL